MGGEPGRDWREAALELFGTDDVDEMRERLDEPGTTLTRDEQWVRRGLLFLALAERDASPPGP